MVRAAVAQHSAAEHARGKRRDSPSADEFFPLCCLCESDTYKDFISAIDDHKRKRAAAQHAAAAQILMQQQAQAYQAQQQQQQQAAAAAAAAAAAHAAAAAAASNTTSDPSASSAIGGYQSGPFDPYASGASARRSLDAEDDYATMAALPVNAMDRDTTWPSSYSGGIGFGVATGAGINSGSGPLGRSGGTVEDEQPLLFEDRGLGGGGVGVTRKSAGDAGSSDHAWISKRNMDLVVQRKSIWIFLNALFGIALMVSILQICWDPLWQTRRYGVDMTAPADYYSDIDFVANRLSLEPQPLPRAWSWQAISQECPSPARSYVTEGLKILLTLSTLILCWQILDRKRMQVNIKFREQRRKLKLKGPAAERERALDRMEGNERYLSMSGNVSNLGLLSLSAGMFRWELWMSLIVCLIQPLPFTQQLTGGVVSDKIGLLMWLRLHLFFRVIRDTSEIWLARRSIKHQSAFQTKVPLFDWWLACKTVCYRDPLFFAGCFYLVSILLFAHALYIAERDLLPKFFDIWTSLFVSLQIVSVGWPADVWEIYMPITVLGKLVSLMAGMAGLLLISFVIASVAQTLYPTKFEENALNFIAMDKVRQKEREGSARLIQYVWKNAAREAELEAKLAPKNPALYEELAEQEEKVFMENFIAKSKELRTLRRERAELEERSDPTSERNISPMDQVSARASERAINRVHFRAAALARL